MNKATRTADALAHPCPGAVLDGRPEQEQHGHQGLDPEGWRQGARPDPEQPRPCPQRGRDHPSISIHRLGASKDRTRGIRRCCAHERGPHEFLPGRTGAREPACWPSATDFMMAAT